MLSEERKFIEKIVEQELSSILLRSLKLAESEGRPEVKDALRVILTAIDSRRDEREGAKSNEP